MYEFAKPELLTSEEDELYTIIDGLDSQAEYLEYSAQKSESNVHTLSCLAMTAIGAAAVSEFLPSDYQFGKYIFATGAGLSAIGAIREHYKWIGFSKKAEPKRRLADKLQQEADELDQSAPY